MQLTVTEGRFWIGRARCQLGQLPVWKGTPEPGLFLNLTKRLGKQLKPWGLPG